MDTLVPEDSSTAGRVRESMCMCVRVCVYEPGKQAQHSHSLAQRKECLVRAAYHAGDLCFPAVQLNAEVNELPRSCAVNSSVLSDSWLTEGKHQSYLRAGFPESKSTRGWGNRLGFF